ncbi:leukocyte elastase inhibitor [Megachile rotundata]|uniref:leukocyte elastase inhibitor n=1 Tax=Megachile rotundata TaxID=143995 RepID=UPI003FD16136
MIAALTLLSLVACSYGRWITPDNVNLTRRSTPPPNPIARNSPTDRINDVDRIYYPSESTIAFEKDIPTVFPYSSEGQYPRQHGFTFGAATALPAAAPPSAAPPPPTPVLREYSPQQWKDHVNNIIVNGLVKFTLDMETNIYKTQSVTITGQQDNIIFSPISLAVTMAIVLAGSAGRTFDEVSKVLGLESGVDISQKSEIVHLMFGQLLNQLLTRIEGSPGPRIDFATASYVQDGYPIRRQFELLSEAIYKNAVINVDFARNGRAAQIAINQWVNAKTRGKISTILNDVPGPETSVILLSALYFSGEWNQHFLERSTRRKQFFIEPDKPVDVDLMLNGGDFPFYEDKQLGVKILALPYKGNETSMYILLPTAEGARALRDFKNQLTADIIEKLINSMTLQTCIIGLPKMKLTSSLQLKSTLAALGLRSLFDPSMADLSLVSAGRGTPMEIQQRNNNDVMVFSRSGEQDNEKRGHMVKRGFFSYEDKVRGLTVQQWYNGFNITRTRNLRHSKTLPLESRNSYSVEGNKPNNDAKIVNLESNKYRFQEGAAKSRSRRERPIDPNFLEYLNENGYRSFGLDELRNSANLVNPHLYASNVLHKVEIEITEKGTEAAAATAVVLERAGNQKKFVANRPFIFFIRHDPTRLILFWGTLNTPTPNFPTSNGPRG